jgi:erythromycin esterase-like protein
MRVSAFLLVTASVFLGACHSAPQAPPPAPRVLSDSAAIALAWVQSHGQQFTLGDSMPNAADRAQIVALAGDAKIVGFTELNEGTREFPLIVRRALFALAEGAGFRGLAIQAPMAEALEVDRYVRTGVGDIRRLLRTLGNWRWEDREMLAIVNAIRSWNQSHADKQIGFYGFEIPTAAHAVEVVTSLPDSITGASLKAWLTQTYGCIYTSESAHWGLEGRASDSTFWNSCGDAAKAGLDSIVALRRRVSSSAAADVAFAETMARLIQHHAALSLRHTKREDANAEHILFLANNIGADGKLVVWGGDVEMARLTLEKTTVQTGVSLNTKLGEKYRPIGFLFGDGVLRTRKLGPRRGGSEPGLSDVEILPPNANTYEDVLIRAQAPAFWLDARTLPNDIGGAWLRGPRRARFVTGEYVPAASELTETPIELPANFDAIVYVRKVTPARQ